MQIADFGMARDVTDDTYYVASGGKIPLRWTAPEVASQSVYRLCTRHIELGSSLNKSLKHLKSLPLYGCTPYMYSYVQLASYCACD